jgi:hypothetical protein
MIEGRVLRGDRRTLTIRPQRGGAVTIERDSIAVLSATSTLTHDRAVSVGTLTAAMGVVILAGATTDCHAANDCYAATNSLWLGGLLGFAAGAVGVQTFADPAPTWRSVSPLIEVGGRSSGVDAPELCQLAPSIHAEMGISSDGSQTQRFAIPFGCYRAVTVGAEIGQPNRIRAHGSTYTPGFSSSTSWDDSRFLTFVGGFAELPVPVALNPRLVVSAGDYHRVEKAQRITYTYSSSGGSSQTSTQSAYDSHHPGVGVGIGISVPCWRQVSLGIEERTHWLIGSGGPVTTVAATARLWP